VKEAHPDITAEDKIQNKILLFIFPFPILFIKIHYFSLIHFNEKSQYLFYLHNKKRTFEALFYEIISYYYSSVNVKLTQSCVVLQAPAISEKETPVNSVSLEVAEVVPAVTEKESQPTFFWLLITSTQESVLSFG
jgi:hypothetical protein